METEASLPSPQEPANIPILRQKSPVHTLQLYFAKTHFDILPSTPRCSESTLPFMHPTCPVHFFLLDLIILISFCGQYKVCVSSLCSFLHAPPLHLSCVQIYSSAPCTQTLCLIPLIRQTSFHTHTMQQVRLYSLIYFTLYDVK